MAHGPLTQNSLRAPDREAARSSSDPALRARPPCGPRRKPVHRPSRAQRVLRSRPQPGPGLGKSLPAWAESRSGDREPSISIRRLREVPGRTKPASVPSRKPASAALSPSPVCAPTVGWTRHRRVASVASLRVHAHRRGGERRLRRGLNAVRSSTRGAPVRSWARPHAD
jgi:hypothetical protein